jgi:hypothetical protein
MTPAGSSKVRACLHRLLIASAVAVSGCGGAPRATGNATNPGSVSVSPSTANVAVSGTLQFTASALDHSGAAMGTQPAFSWTVSGGGTIDTSGLFQAGSATGGPWVVTAAGGGMTGTASVTVSASATQFSTETAQAGGAVNFSLGTAPPYNYFVGAWTRVVPPMGSGVKGNDYPFTMYCQEGAIDFVSGNIATPYLYNANIMTFDPSGNYITDYTVLTDDSTSEATCRDWVYVGWHFQRVGTSTSVTQYVKYIGSANLVDRKITQTVPGNWTPTHLLVGGDPLRDPPTPMYLMYARIYAMDAPPTDQQVNAIYMHSATPDPTAWADWPLVGGDPSDVSGNGRNLTVNGAVTEGIVGPPQLP